VNANEATQADSPNPGEAAAANRARFEEEAMKHLDALYRTALRMTRNPSDAEDLVQDALVRAFRFYDRFQPGTNFRAWLFKILTNTYINTYRRKQGRPQESSLEDTEEFFLYNQLSSGDGERVTDVEDTVMSRLFRGRRQLQRALWDQAQAAGFTAGSKVHLGGADKVDSGTNGSLAKMGGRTR
jgi:RNA polymerase sigma factor (sigma-70 family)